ncbi:MAG: hypothetical protein ABIH28_02870 [archaeon]
MTDKTISVYWFFILFIVSFAIVFIIYSLYGKPLDVRQMEGLFLAEKLADCVSQGGKISPGILDDKGALLINNGNLLKTCGLNFEVEQFKGWNNDQFYVSLLFSQVGGTSLPLVFYGNENLNSLDYNRNFMDSKKNKFPFCVDRTIYSNGADRTYYSIKIIACVRKTEKNA